MNVVENNINGQRFTTSDQYSIFKNPIQYRGDVEAKYNLSKKTLLEYSVRYRNENIMTSNDVLQNNSTGYNTSLGTKNKLFKQTLTYTSRLSDKKAVQIVARNVYNDIPQNYAFVPAIYEPTLFSSNNQLSRFKKRNLNIQSSLLGSTAKGKYAVSLGANFVSTHFASDLKGRSNNDEIFINGFNNIFFYTQRSMYANGSYKFQFNRFRLTPAMTLTYLHQNLAENDKPYMNDTANFLIEPSLAVGYKLNNYSALLLTTAYRQKPFSEDYFVPNPVYLSNRVIRSNEVSLQLQQGKTISLFYLISNLYRQLQVNIGGIYAENRGNYFSNLFVQQNNTKMRYFFLPEPNRLLSLNFMVEKYLPFLQSTLRLKNDYSLQGYKNIINNSSLRNNTSYSLANELFFKTAFDGKINFENTFRWRVLKSKAEGGAQFENQALNNNFQVIAKPLKRVLFVISTDYFLPNTQKKEQDYFFLDATLYYQTQNKIYDLRFTAKNMTNIKTLNQFDTNDFSTTFFQTNLLPRHVVVSISRNF